MWQYVTVECRPEGYALLTMKKEPVNSLNTDMWSELLSALHHVEAQENMKALVIASGLKKDIFSAGNDLLELYAPNTSLERYNQFWIVQNRFITDLYKSRLATVAAIRGACPAGGCVISLCCDHRIMTFKGTIGLNEVALGISVPKYWAQLMGNVIGQVKAEQLLMTGRMISAEQAKDWGMVDDLVGGDQLLSKACALAANLVRIPAVPRAIVKKDFRAAFAEEWYQYALQEPKWAWEFLQQPATVELLGKTLARLSSKPAPKL